MVGGRGLAWGPHGPISVGCGFLFLKGHRLGAAVDWAAALAVISVLPGTVCALSRHVCLVWAGGG